MRARSPRSWCRAVSYAQMLTFAFSLPAFAVQRTFVASDGIDTNACSKTSPCRSFSAAIAKTDVKGEIVVLDSAGYGSVTIGKSVGIVAPPGIYGGISSFSGTNGININGANIDVALTGLTINGQGGSSGIKVVAAASVTIDRCNVANFNASGLQVAAPGVMVRATDSSFRANGFSGVYMLDGNLTMERSRADDNFYAGVVVVNTRTSIDSSSLSGNGFYGLRSDLFTGGAAFVTVSRTLVAGNGDHGLAAWATVGSIHLVARENAISDNGALCPTCAGVLSEASPGQQSVVFASNNVVTRSGGYGLKQTNSGVFQTGKDNVVIDNGVAETSGTIGTVTGL